MISKDNRQNSKYFHAILEAIPFPFYVVNVKDYSIALANSATGVPEEDKHATCHKLTHHLESPCGIDSDCICPLEEMKRTGKPVTVEHAHPGLDGTIRYFDIHGYPIFDEQGELVQMIEFGVDVTPRKRVEQELRQSRLELVEINKEIEKSRCRLQHALDEISALLQAVIRQKDFKVRFTTSGLARCYETKQCGQRECPCFDQEAERCWQISGTFCGGEVQGAFAQKLSSCTECVVYEQATANTEQLIGEYFNNMMYILESKNQELEKAYRDLKETQSQMLHAEKMASIGQLAAGIAHEINNPMSYIASNLSAMSTYASKLFRYTELLEETLEGASLPEEKLRPLREQRRNLKIDFIREDLRDLLAESLDGSGRVTDIVKNLKSFARLEGAGRQEANINDCLESTLKIIHNELKYKATIIKDYGEIPLLDCIPNELNQVFMNILINAGQAIATRGTITIKTRADDSAIFVAIGDTGCGIAQADLNRIFEPFFTTKEVGKGTGLGMSISFDIVRKHGGGISVVSEVDKGTTFTVTLPLRRQQGATDCPLNCD